jgi:predicted secreted protein
MGRSTFGVLYAGWVVTVIVGSVVQVYGLKQALSAYFVVFQLIIGALFAYILQDKSELAWVGAKLSSHVAMRPASAANNAPGAPRVSPIARLHRASGNVVYEIRKTFNDPERAEIRHRKKLALNQEKCREKFKANLKIAEEYKRRPRYTNFKE